MASASYYAQHREVLKSKAKLRYAAKRAEIRERQNAARRSLSPEQRERVAQYQRDYRNKNRGDCTANYLRWRKRNPERARVISNRYLQKVRATPEGQLNLRMSKAIRESLGVSKCYRHWGSMVSYTVAELKRHLESLFTNGMSWAKVVSGEIHIDHKVPKSKFRFSSPSDIGFRQCWALENLQPKWAGENIRKKHHILEPTQIALGL